MRTIFEIWDFFKRLTLAVACVTCLIGYVVFLKARLYILGRDL